MASNPSIYSTAFHDINVGGNQCGLGPTFCSTASQSLYASTTGYDLASGLGSIDLANLVASWPANPQASLTPTQTLITLQSSSQTAGAPQVATVAVSGNLNGTVTVLLDGTPIQSNVILSGPGTQVSFTTPTAVGGHVLTAFYSGDATYAPSRGSTAFTVGSTLPAGGTFGLTATNVSLPTNGTGNSTLTLTPDGTYNGTVNFTLSTSDASVQLCYYVAQLSLYSGAPTTTTLYLGSGSTCTSSSASGSSAFRQVAVRSPQVALATPSRTRPLPATSLPSRPSPASRPVLALLLLTGIFGVRRSSRRNLPVLCLLLFSVSALTLTGCGGSGSASAPTPTPTQPTPTPTSKSVTLTVSGNDSINYYLGNKTSFTVTLTN